MYPDYTPLVLMYQGYELDEDFIYSADQGLTWRHTDAQPAPVDIEAQAMPCLVAAVKQRVNEVAHEKILAMAPEHKQRNATARGLEITEKLVEGVALTAEEMADRRAIKGLWAVVKTIRVASDQKASEVEALCTVSAVQSYDPETGWPE